MTLVQMYELYKNGYAAHADIGEVTYQDSTETIANVKARKCAPRDDELASVGAHVGLQTTLATFVLWDVSLDDTEPKPGGKITWPGSGTWTIVSLRREHFDTQWRCLCRQDK
ncbi:hypothetical protein Pan97_24680 [Bremerella volcania]|uniref:Uncharacterized protein n=1 Tax=Bremerella volcania TaxID=2527984 RepID=A0A518C880_9BACT|nr:hypothetical protein [Bremerella volcania]QDU75436.1 hypothetical protein Pan97_24680 [Bremerella volcania]